MRSPSTEAAATPDADAPAVDVDDLWVSYATQFERKLTVKRLFSDPRRRWRKQRTIEALRGIDFEVAPGRVLCVVGDNGAGKSTLLRVLAGIIPPSGGRVVVRGEVATVLALGAAFNRSLSGRENILLGGMAAGLSRAEVLGRMDEVEQFAELGEFIDAPTRIYSSGMFARLAFSVAINVDPDILLIDEALGAGDQSFREKCNERIRTLCSEEGRTVVMVTHNLDVADQLAHETLWLEKGQIKALGPTTEVVPEYRRFKHLARRAAGGVVRA